MKESKKEKQIFISYARLDDEPFVEKMRDTLKKKAFDVWWDRIEAKLVKMDPVAFATLLPQLAEQETVVERLSEIVCPTTVIVGEEDLPFLSAATELAAAIPDAIHVTIPNAAHSPQLENPDAWRDAILLHLERSRARTS